jgi:predicted P-loop ATPase
LSYDEMECTAVLHRSLDPEPPEGFAARPVSDVDVNRVQMKLQQLGLSRLSHDTACQAVATVADDKKVHPLRDYLTSLKWDGKPRVKDWLSTYLGAKRTPYSEGVGTMFLVAMVARVLRPGVKHDHMMILEGEQGEMKSTACEVLAGEWFSDDLPELDQGKECSQHLRGKWLIEFSEMHVHSRATSSKFKAFASRKVERYRPTYGRRDVHQKRQCVFIGTTNLNEYLRDETGARRFWPVRVKDIDIDALKADRDQLFAEAMQMFRDGVKWYPTKNFEKEHIKPEQDDRYEGDEWENDIAEYLQGKTAVLISEVALGALGFESQQRLGTADQWRIRRAMQHLRWERGKRGPGGKRYWVPMD